ncbi:MAG: hypothetical protein H6809_03095 [Phycisphaeraceae bacterium]|nr:hypothetical protein [Phycisphaeraceae bacterium]
MPETEQAPHHRSSIKETVTQLIIAFVMAFVFRGFVIEAFLIPTGSMAPTLMGAHVNLTSDVSGYNWSMTPWLDGPGGTPANQGLFRVEDPMTGVEVNSRPREPLMGGDRIFVLKYLPYLYDPARFDCVVFKNPTNPDENYIKRLIGLAGEQVALIHGDVFVRTPPAGEEAPVDWHASGWRIARKPERVQQTLWMPVFSSEYAPLSPTLAPNWVSPWVGTGGFEVGTDPAYVHRGSGVATIRWNDVARPIDDFCPYNVRSTGSGTLRFFVPDIRIRAGVRPDAQGVVVSPIITTCGFEIRGDIDSTSVTIRRRPVPTADGLGVDEPGEWETMATGTLGAPLATDRFTDVEFWHADQAIGLVVDGRRVAYAEYDWSPAERIEHAMGRSIDDLLDAEAAYRGGRASVDIPAELNLAQISDALVSRNIFAVKSLYRPSTARWEVRGPVTMTRVGLDHDLYYQATIYRGDQDGPHPLENQPARGTHPEQPNLLGPDQYFTCGDNSAASLDARLWDRPDPWVAAELDDTMGVVPRDLLIGKAFFVYFPAMKRERPVPMIDFGRMRFIW